jgi:transposase
MEKLKVQQVQEIIHRLRMKQSERSIVRDLGCARETVRRYSSLARERGYLSEDVELPSLTELAEASAPGYVPRRTNISSVEPYRSVVEALVKEEAEAKAIHRCLRVNHGYTGSYSSVIRFLVHVRPHVPDAVIRIETAAGKQAQVDFGTVGMMWDPVLKCRRTAYCFVMTLSWSRHMYVRFVFDQRIPTWLECHHLAFEAFGGVPEEIVIDNLKAAVLEAKLNDTVLSTPYNRFAREYGFLVHPCRPRTPEHKGKVESGVHYVKRNFIASETILDINDANRKVALWVSEEAGLRVHGTTFERPMARFLETERALLKPLPATPYDLEEVVRATLHRDCYVQVHKAYYSAPYELVGQVFDVYIYHQTVQIFSDTTLITTHPRATHKGQRLTRDEHLPPEKSIYMVQTRSWCKEKASQIGMKCRAVVDQLLDNGPLDKLRSVQGILRLTDRFPSCRVEKACARALHFGDPSGRRIKSILFSGLDLEPLAEKTVQLKLVSYAFTRHAEEFFAPEEMTC